MRVVEGRITSGFGMRVHPVTGMKGSFHNGVDVAAPIGTEVCAPCDGVVREVYRHPTGGLTLIVGDDEREVRFGFCHLSKVFWAVGTKFYRGGLIALTGNTGRTTGAHCHFTVKAGGRWEGVHYVGGEWVDPVKYLEL